MEQQDPKQHWEQVYQTKALNEVSWYQPIPYTSLMMIKSAELPINAAIIDVGGGDSFLADHLLGSGYTNLTVLDISEAAINRAKQRLGDDAKRIKWIVTDVTAFKPTEAYDLWHDRAAFHFLTHKDQTSRYLNIIKHVIKPGGHLLVSTFSDNGPKKCSGLEIARYSDTSLPVMFEASFQKIKCSYEDHATPFNTLQNFVCCHFKKK